MTFCEMLVEIAPVEVRQVLQCTIANWDDESIPVRHCKDVMLAFLRQTVPALVATSDLCDTDSCGIMPFSTTDGKFVGVVISIRSHANRELFYGETVDAGTDFRFVFNSQHGGVLCLYSQIEGVSLEMSFVTCAECEIDWDMLQLFWGQ
jgi:hypothetical protein